MCSSTRRTLNWLGAHQIEHLFKKNGKMYMFKECDI